MSSEIPPVNSGNIHKVGPEPIVLNGVKQGPQAENTGVTGVITLLNRSYNPIYSWFLVLPRQNELSTRPNQRSVNAVKEVSRMSSGKIDISAVVFRKIGGGSKICFSAIFGSPVSRQFLMRRKENPAINLPWQILVLRHSWFSGKWMPEKKSSYLSNTAIFHFPMLI